MQTTPLNHPDSGVLSLIAPRYPLRHLSSLFCAQFSLDLSGPVTAPPLSSPSMLRPNEEGKGMLLGKRPRPSAMKRTTSLSEFAPNLLVSDQSPDPNPRDRQKAAIEAEVPAVVAASPERRSRSMELTREIEAAEFLRACGICKRHLGPGRDTFIYRGEAAFCSLECRQKQMKSDAVKEKILRMSRKSKAPPPKPGPKASGSSGTVAAA